jgi:serine/threonine protein kinase
LLLQVMHSDMKARNVLLSKGRETAKISDVGVARYLNECATATQSNYVAWTFAYAGAKAAFLTWWSLAVPLPTCLLL